MSKSLTRALLGGSIVLGALLVLTVAFGTSPGYAADVNRVALDTNTTGNTATALGTTETCGVISAVAGTLVVDLIVDSVPSPDGTSGFDMTLTYDPAKVSVTAKDNTVSIVHQGAGSTPFAVYDSLPDTDGSFHMSDLDIGGSYVSGAGILVRLTFTAVAAGTSPLALTQNNDASPSVYNGAAGTAYSIGAINGAQIVVGGTCGAVTNSPPPTHSPSPTGTGVTNSPSPTGTGVTNSPSPTGTGGTETPPVSSTPTETATEGPSQPPVTTPATTTTAAPTPTPTPTAHPTGSATTPATVGAGSGTPTPKALPNTGGSTGGTSDIALLLALLFGIALIGASGISVLAARPFTKR